MTAYEMRISDWSSDLCSSDLRHLREALVAQAEAQIIAANAEVVRTRADVSRYRQLASAEFVSQQRLQQADADNRKGAAAVDSARAARDAAERQLAVIDTQKQQVRAALAAAEANVEIAQLNLGYTELRAPVDGTNGTRSARVGASATHGPQRPEERRVREEC